MNKLKQKVGRGQSDINVLKERFGQLQQPSQQVSQPTQQSVQKTQPQTIPPASARTQSAPQSYQQASQPSQQPIQTSFSQQQPYPNQPTPPNPHLLRQASNQTVQNIPQSSPYPDSVTAIAAGQGKNPFEALSQTPSQQQGSVQFVELEGTAGSIINQATIEQSNIPLAQQPLNQQGLPPNMNSQPTTKSNPTTSVTPTGSEAIIEESLEELRSEYDDAKLNSIIIEQVKELIEIDNNLNNKIEDLRTDLKKETEEREKLAKLMDERHKELQELEDSIQKFIALYEVVTNQFNPFIKQSPEAEARMHELTKGKQQEKSVHDSQHFISKTGARVGTLSDLISIITNMNDEEFHHHVTPVKNDFAIWIHDTFKDEDLAQKVSAHKTKEGILKTLTSQS
jgi:archaellum component FlaC